MISNVAYYVLLGGSMCIILLFLYNRECYKKLHEDFCFACSSSTNVNVVNKVFNETLNKSMLSATQKCQNKITSSQIINAKCDSTPEVVATFGNLRAQCIKDILEYNLANKDKTPLNPDEACKSLFPCYYQDITQDSTISFNASCEIDNTLVTKIQAEMKKQLDEKYTSNTDGFTDALNSIADGIVNSSVGGSSNSNTSVVQDIKNSMTNIVDVKLMQEMVGQFVLNQNITLSGGSARGINQKNMLSIQQSILSKNQAYNDLINKMDIKEKKDTSITTRGVTDIVSSFFDFLTSGYIGIVVCAIAIMILIGFLGYMFFKTPDSANKIKALMKK